MILDSTEKCELDYQFNIKDIFWQSQRAAERGNFDASAATSVCMTACTRLTTTLGISVPANSCHF